MAYTITKDCIGCGACVPVCPQACISEGDPYVIAAADCIDCDACADECPVGACVKA